MLKDHLRAGVKMLGLAELVNSGRPAFDGCYRVVKIGPTTAVEFFESASRPDSGVMHRVRILPYRSAMIAQTPLGGIDCISGEFSGCVMTLFMKAGILTAGHVDTNGDNSQRDAYKTLMDEPNNTLVAESDTTGALPSYVGVTASTRLFCVATQTGVDNYFVSKSNMNISKFTTAHLLGDDTEKWRQRSEAVYTVL